MSGPDLLLSCAGGDLVLPAPDLVLVDREDGGNRRLDEAECGAVAAAARALLVRKYGIAA